MSEQPVTHPAAAVPAPIAPAAPHVPSALAAAPQSSSKPEITFDEFAKVDLRVARILVAENHPSADRLFRLQLDDGSGTPRQMAFLFMSLCLLSVGIATACWVHGATLVMPFAGLELLAVATALLLYARHATDRESIHLRTGLLTVEHVSGRSVERVELTPAWVRVEPQHGDRSLVELSGQGRRIAVGRFVRPELRRQLADELRWALRRGQGVQIASRAGEAP